MQYPKVMFGIASLVLLSACTGEGRGEIRHQSSLQVTQAFFEEWTGHQGNPVADKLYESSTLVTPAFKTQIAQAVAANPAQDPVLCTAEKPTNIEYSQPPSMPTAGRTSTVMVQETAGSAVQNVRVRLALVGGDWKVDTVTCVPAEAVRDRAQEGEFCGGIAGIACDDGLSCNYDGTFPDAGGTCVRPK